MTRTQFELGVVGSQDKWIKQIRNNMLQVSCLYLKLPVYKKGLRQSNW